MPYGSKLHTPPTNYHLLAAQQKPYKKASLNEKFGTFSGGEKKKKKKVKENTRNRDYMINK